MAFGTPTLPTSVVGATGSSVTTAPFSPPLYSYLIAIAGARTDGAVPPTISDSVGHSPWTQLNVGAGIDSGDIAGNIYYQQVLSRGAPPARTVTASSPGATQIGLIIIQVTGVGSSSGGSLNFSNFQGIANATGDPSVTLAALASTSVAIGLYIQNAGAAPTQTPVGYAELINTEIATNLRMGAWFDMSAPGTTLSWTSSGTDTLGYGFEFRYPFAASAFLAENDDTVTASNALPGGSVGLLEDDDTVTATTAVLIKGAASITETNDTVSSTATILIKGTATLTEADDAVSSVMKLVATGDMALTEGPDTVTATATKVDVYRAETALVEDDDTLSASALMPIFYLRRGGDDEWARYEQRQIEWEQQLRRIIDQSWQIAHGEIDPVTFLPIPPPDYSAVIDELMRQALALDQARVEAFIAEQERLQEDEAISLLLLAA
jgi:hypothetical protein